MAPVFCCFFGIYKNTILPDCHNVIRPPRHRIMRCLGGPAFLLTAFLLNAFANALPSSEYQTRPLIDTTALPPAVFPADRHDGGACTKKGASEDASFHFAQETGTTFTARSFPLSLGSGSVSNVTFCPSFNVRNPSVWIAEKCTNTSSPPSSLAMKPYPLPSLNHFTVPFT